MGSTKMTFKQFIANIEKDNKKFETSSKAEQRVAIAKDCIERVNFSQLQARRCTVVKFNSQVDDDAQIKDVVNNSRVTCKVCAKGALFMSYVGRVNNFKVGKVEDSNLSDGEEMKKLKKVFSWTQLNLIETAFEGLQWAGRTLSAERLREAKCFYEKYENNDERLIAICKNIIKNKGTFVL